MLKPTFASNSVRKLFLTLSLGCALGSFCFHHVSAYAQAGTPIWTNHYGPGDIADSPKAIAVDPDGNAYVTGYSGDGGLGVDYATVAYSSSGMALWTNRFNGGGAGAGNDYAEAIRVATNGNVYVTGWSFGLVGGYDYLTIAYTKAGVPLWTNRFNGLGNANDIPTALAVLDNGGVCVTGSSRSTGLPGSEDFTTVAYSSTGTLLWVNRFNGSANGADYARAIVVGANDTVYVTGYALNTGAGQDYVTIAYSAGGAPLWNNTYTSPGNADDEAFALCVGQSGNVYVTGMSTNPIGYGRNIYATVAYSSSGLPLWTNFYGGPNGRDEAHAVAADKKSENVYVTGYAFDGIVGYDYSTVVAYSAAGSPIWTNSYNLGPYRDYSTALAVDADGNVYVTGLSQRSSLGSSGDFATIAYSDAGVALWTNRYNGTANNADLPAAIFVDGIGNVSVTGQSSETGRQSDFTTIKYRSLIPPPLISLGLLNLGDRIVLDWSGSQFSLQAAPSPIGIFTNVPGASSPYTNAISQARQFFRLRSD